MSATLTPTAVDAAHNDSGTVEQAAQSSISARLAMDISDTPTPSMDVNIPHPSTFVEPTTVPPTFFSVTCSDDPGVKGSAWAATFDIDKVARLEEFAMHSFRSFPDAHTHYSKAYAEGKVSISKEWTPPPPPPKSPIMYSTVLEKGTPNHPVHIASVAPTPIPQAKKPSGKMPRGPKTLTMADIMPLKSIPESIERQGNSGKADHDSDSDISVSGPVIIPDPISITVASSDDSEGRDYPTPLTHPWLFYARRIPNPNPTPDNTDVFGTIKTSLSATATPSQSASDTKKKQRAHKRRAEAPADTEDLTRLLSTGNASRTQSTQNVTSKRPKVTISVLPTNASSKLLKIGKAGGKSAPAKPALKARAASAPPGIQDDSDDMYVSDSPAGMKA